MSNIVDQIKALAQEYKVIITNVKTSNTTAPEVKSQENAAATPTTQSEAQAATPATQSEAQAATPVAGKYYTHDKAAQVKLAKGANAKPLTADAENLLKAILAASGVFNTTYTSTLRTYDDQARILLQKTAAQVQSLGYYGGAADFITAFNKYKASNDRNGFAAYMQARDAKRGKAISNHIPGYAIDIPRNTSVNSFLSKNGSSVKGFSKFLDEPKNNCTHIEFTFLVCGQSNAGGAAAMPQDASNNAAIGTTISASVGNKGKNIAADVKVIQKLLNDKGAKLEVDGICGNGTINAIGSYQKSVMKIASPDGRVDVNGATWKSLSSGATPAPAAAEQPIAATPATEAQPEAQATPLPIPEPVNNDDAKDESASTSEESTSSESSEGASTSEESTSSESSEGASTSEEGSSSEGSESASTSEESTSSEGSESASTSEESTSSEGSESASAPAASSVTISASVGNKGKNIAEDVKVIQQLLNDKGAKLEVDGLCGKGTINAIGSYQKSVMKIASPDGRVDVNGATWKSLTGESTAAPANAASSNSSEAAATTTNTDAPAPTAAQKRVMETAKSYDAFLKEAADKYGMRFAHLKAIMCVESNANPTASSGAAFGLMQLTKETWGDVQKKFSELSSYGFDRNWTNPRINILFGAAALKLKARSMGVEPSDPNFPALGVTAYNAGEGTVKKAMANATAGGSKNPAADFLKPEFLKPAIQHYNLHKYYLTGGGKKSNKSGSVEEAVNLKYKEITGYAPKVSTYLSMQ